MSLEPLFVLVGALFGGGGLKIIEYALKRTERKETLATEIRRELREDVGQLREELRQEAREADEWREKYYQCLESKR